MVERSNDDVPRHFEPAAQIVPDRDAELVAGFSKAQKCVAAVTAPIAACPGADFPPRDITADIVLRPVGVERDFRPIQHHQQLELVGMQSRQQAVQRDKAGAAEQEAVEPGPQTNRLALAGFDPVRLETGVEVPDQAANARLGSTMLVGKRVQLIPIRLNIDTRPAAGADGLDAIWIVDQPVPGNFASLQYVVIGVPNLGT